MDKRYILKFKTPSGAILYYPRGEPGYPTVPTDSPNKAFVVYGAHAAALLIGRLKGLAIASGLPEVEKMVDGVEMVEVN